MHAPLPQTLTFRGAQQAYDPAAAPLTKFANPAVLCEGWYFIARSRDFKVGAIRSFTLYGTELVLYRSLAGTLHAVERACPHLGADLANGRVVEKGLQCSFHRWCWGPDGQCAAGGGVAEKRRIRTWSVRERWGLVWLWAGDGEPRYELPMPEPGNARHVLGFPAQRLKCHPHVVLGNGLDFTHVGPIHNFHLLEDPKVELDPPRLSVEIRPRFSGTFMRRVLGLANRDAHWRFTTIGPSLAWLTVFEPTAFELLWAARPLADGTCTIRTLYFLPRRRTALRAVPMMLATTFNDVNALRGLRFRQGFVPSDAVFQLYAQFIESLPAGVP